MPRLLTEDEEIILLNDLQQLITHIQSLGTGYTRSKFKLIYQYTRRIKRHLDTCWARYKALTDPTLF